MARQRIAEEAVKVERGRRLAERRRMLLGTNGKRLSQEELGVALDVSRAQVSKYERGEDLLDAEKAYRFAKALRCRFLDIFVAGRLELAEETASFRFVDDGAGASLNPEDELAVLMAQARASMSPERRLILRDVILELMAAEETSPRVAPRKPVL